MRRAMVVIKPMMAVIVDDNSTKIDYISEVSYKADIDDFTG